jgi:hypothetical protein
VVAIANAFGSQDLSQAKSRIELLFANADRDGAGHFAVAQLIRARLARALNETKSAVGRQFLSDVIGWLDREHGSQHPSK